MSKRRYWYHIHIYECPVCGRWDQIRERQYGRKPKGYEATHTHHVGYDWCDV